MFPSIHILRLTETPKQRKQSRSSVKIEHATNSDQSIHNDCRTNRQRNNRNYSNTDEQYLSHLNRQDHTQEIFHDDHSFTTDRFDISDVSDTPDVECDNNIVCGYSQEQWSNRMYQNDRNNADNIHRNGYGTRSNDTCADFNEDHLKSIYFNRFHAKHNHQIANIEEENDKQDHYEGSGLLTPRVNSNSKGNPNNFILNRQLDPATNSNDKANQTNFTGNGQLISTIESRNISNISEQILNQINQMNQLHNIVEKQGKQLEKFELLIKAQEDIVKERSSLSKIENILQLNSQLTPVTNSPETKEKQEIENQSQKLSPNNFAFSVMEKTINKTSDPFEELIKEFSI